eukprot:TRINITY_DN30333_c0_g1_i1.p2 TRINITY_DN30333_c0_g1~~TRINITY_DN30333_c0_g1_i1.p2  ORF type:complete len:407 (+),score=173.01 TRINITY_DN30333_c0_g1_i1:53-1222(+)
MGKARKYLRNLQELLASTATPWGRGKNCVGLVGIKSDCHSSFLRGCAEAPDRIRDAFASESSNPATEAGREIVVRTVEQHAAEKDLAGVLNAEQEGKAQHSYNVIDLGNIEFDHEDEKDPEEMFNCIVEFTRLVNEKNIVPIALGGDHSITYPLFYGLVTTPKKNIAHEGGSWNESGDMDVQRPNIIHFDAHPDLYPDFEGNPYSHASPFARILEKDVCSKLTQFGVRCGNPVQNAFLRDYPHVEQVPMDQFYFMTPEERAEAVVQACHHNRSTLGQRGYTYISVDLDCLDPAFAPGISHYEPGGMSVRDLLHMIQAVPAANTAVIGADIVEYNPTRDRDNQTAMVAAKIFKEVLQKMSMRQGKPTEVNQKDTTKKKQQPVEWPWKRYD